MTLYIYGSGGLGKEVLDVIMNSHYKQMKISFLNDWSLEVDQLFGHDIFNPSKVIVDDSSRVLIAVGAPQDRHKLREKISKINLHLHTPVHAESGFISMNAEVGLGTIIAHNVVVASQATIGTNTFINVGSIIGHNVVIGNDCSLSSQVNIGGGTSIGDRTYIGMGSLIREGLKIGEDSIIGMGSVVFNDIPNGVIAIGNPARVVKRNDSGVSFKNSQSQ